jgi:hypothetical protein
LKLNLKIQIIKENVVKFNRFLTLKTALLVDWHISLCVALEIPGENIDEYFNQNPKFVRAIRLHQIF